MQKKIGFLVDFFCLVDENGKFCVTGVKVLADHGQMHTTISYMFR